MTIYQIYGLFLPYFRRRRMRRFVAHFSETLGKEASALLDVGGYVRFWTESENQFAGLSVTIVNTHVQEDAAGIPAHICLQCADGRQLSFQDEMFEIGFSNSVIEHVGSFADQKRFAREIARVSEGLWVQTPARSFLIEPHFITPFIHFFPKAWQKRLVRRCTVWGLLTKPSQAEIDSFVDEIRLLTFGEMRELFPDCLILRERFLFLTKAFIAFRPAKARALG